MGASLERGTGTPPTAEAVEAGLRDQGLTPRSWANGPGDRYDSHEHGYHKVLWCVEGSIVFHTADGDLAMEAGDRLDIPPGTPHAATVGPSGCRCVEAATRSRS